MIYKEELGLQCLCLARTQRNDTRIKKLTPKKFGRVICKSKNFALIEYYKYAQNTNRFFNMIGILFLLQIYTTNP